MLKQWSIVAAVIPVVAVATVIGQAAAVTPQQAAPFIGTWVFTMTHPPEFKNSPHTVRIWEENGKVAASVQAGKFPPNNATGIYQDGDMLVLSISRDAPSAVRENGLPIWIVASLTRDGDGMKMSLMLEPSVTIKKGTGRKQAE
jgi:hypothetical protein